MVFCLQLGGGYLPSFHPQVHHFFLESVRKILYRTRRCLSACTPSTSSPFFLEAAQTILYRTRRWFSDFTPSAQNIPYRTRWWFSVLTRSTSHRFFFFEIGPGYSVQNSARDVCIQTCKQNWPRRFYLEPGDGCPQLVWNILSRTR